MRRLWRGFDGTGVRTAVGACLLAVAALFAYLVLSSGGGWQWFGGRAVAGREDTGTVAYVYRGQHYDIDDPTSFRSGPRTVWVNPARPSEATLHITVARVSDSLFVGVPAVLGSALIAAGLVQKHRRRSRPALGGGDGTGYGRGIDSATIAGILASRRRPRRAPP